MTAIFKFLQKKDSEDSVTEIFVSLTQYYMGDYCVHFSLKAAVERIFFYG